MLLGWCVAVGHGDGTAPGRHAALPAGARTHQAGHPGQRRRYSYCNILSPLVTQVKDGGTVTVTTLSPLITQVKDGGTVTVTSYPLWSHRSKTEVQLL